MMKKIAVLGSTGSIGTQTLEVVRYNKDIQVTALAAGGNVKLMEEQIREFKPRLACLWDEEKAKELRAAVADLDECIDTVGAQLLAVIPESRVLQLAGANGTVPPAGDPAVAAGQAMAKRLCGQRVPLTF